MDHINIYALMKARFIAKLSRQTESFCAIFYAHDNAVNQIYAACMYIIFLMIQSVLQTR